MPVPSWGPCTDVLLNTHVFINQMRTADTFAGSWGWGAQGSLGSHRPSLAASVGCAGCGKVAYTLQGRGVPAMCCDFFNLFFS